MDRKLIGAILLMLASSGCCTCDCSCDYLPPVLDGPYASVGMRSGSAMSNDAMTSDATIVPFAEEPITPLPAKN